MNAKWVRHDGHSSCGLVLLASFEPRRDMNPEPAGASFGSQPDEAEQQALQEPADPRSDDATSTSSASPQILHEALRSAYAEARHPRPEPSKSTQNFRLTMPLKHARPSVRRPVGSSTTT